MTKERGKNRILFRFLLFLIIINLSIFVLFIFKPALVKKRTARNYAIAQNSPNEFYNTQCPEVDIVTADEERFNLHDYFGSVIIIHFSKFNISDLPYLLYLDHLYGKFKENGLCLFLIHPLGNNQLKASNSLSNLNSKVIEDSGSLLPIFNAFINDTVIIGKDFRIKYKSYSDRNYTIYDQIIRYLFDNTKLDLLLPDEELAVLLKSTIFTDVLTGEINNFGDLLRNCPTFVNIQVSTCFRCPEQKRISVLREFSSEMNSSDGKLVFLFGRGNSIERLRIFAEDNALFSENTTIGLIDDVMTLNEEDYYKIFKLEIDPYLIYFNKEGNLEYTESLKDQNKFSLDKLRNLLK